jgi:uncharacterized protein
MDYSLHALCFSCGRDRLVGVVSRPAQPSRRGVLVLVGGPQYRVGSHRQFALLADRLSQQGIAVMRFDYRGMGDSTGEPGEIDSWKLELRFALDAFFETLPELEDVVIWGLCEGATAASLYAYRDARVTGMVLLNPWVRTPQGEARAYLRHYYRQRLFSPALWRKLIGGEFALISSVRSFATIVRRAIASGADDEPGRDAAGEEGRPGSGTLLPDRMAHGLARFKGPVLLILSGNDLTAQEFLDVAETSQQWRELLTRPRVTRHTLPDATHTFSRHEWREQVAIWTAAWVGSW